MDEKLEIMQQLQDLIRKNIPNGFEEGVSYSMKGWVVPHSLYPAGYHCKPEEPLPFISVAIQKHFVALYHMGLYANPDLFRWFVQEYPKHSKTKLDMGKSCIRFKKINDVPLQLLAELFSKMTAREWIDLYEFRFRKK